MFGFFFSLRNIYFIILYLLCLLYFYHIFLSLKLIIHYSLFIIFINYILSIKLNIIIIISNLGTSEIQRLVIASNVLKEYNIKYNTDEIKKLYILYDYLLLQMDNEPEHIKLQIKEDLEIIMTYLHN